MLDKYRPRTFEELLEGEVQVSLINEPVEEPPRESATARALRRWFKQSPRAEVTTSALPEN
jgi:hypothetical protein